jgi:hypothetical protein
VKKLLVSLLIAGGALLPTFTGVSYASPANGELCSVQTFDGSVRTSVYPYPDTTRPSQTQLQAAGAWCTNQIATPGWYAANKYYDSWNGQQTVCLVHLPYSSIATMQFADPTNAYALSFAVQGCKDMAGGDPNAIAWYPS